jgi:hypothetical protein
MDRHTHSTQIERLEVVETGRRWLTDDPANEPKKHRTTGSNALFRARLDQIINMKDELVQLAGKIDSYGPIDAAGMAGFGPAVASVPRDCSESPAWGNYRAWSSKGDDRFPGSDDQKRHNTVLLERVIRPVDLSTVNWKGPYRCM